MADINLGKVWSGINDKSARKCGKAACPLFTPGLIVGFGNGYWKNSLSLLGYLTFSLSVVFASIYLPSAAFAQNEVGQPSKSKSNETNVPAIENSISKEKVKQIISVLATYLKKPDMTLNMLTKQIFGQEIEVTPLEHGAAHIHQGRIDGSPDQWFKHADLRKVPRENREKLYIQVNRNKFCFNRADLDTIISLPSTIVLPHPDFFDENRPTEEQFKENVFGVTYGSSNKRMEIWFSYKKCAWNIQLFKK